MASSRTALKRRRIHKKDLLPLCVPRLTSNVLPSRIGLNHKTAFARIDDVCIEIESTQRFLRSPSLLHTLVYNLNRFGVCLIQLQNYDNTVFGHRQLLKRNMYDIKPLFGETAFHQKSDPRNGILTIDPRTPNSVNVARTDIPHPPHTDGAFLCRPEKIVTLAAEHAAKDGGDTTLICAQSMLETVLSMMPAGGDAHLDQRRAVIQALLAKDAIEIGRQLPSTKPDDRTFEELHSQQAVLSYLHEYDDDDACGAIDHDKYDSNRCFHSNDNLRLVYHGNPSYLRNIRSDVKQVWDLMSWYCSHEMSARNVFTFKLQPGQILVMDNTAFLHGRTPYDASTNLRVLHRLNFFNNGLLKNAVKLGINNGVINQYL